MCKYFIICILLLLLAGCESLVQFPEVPVNSRKAVIESILTDKHEIQQVRVSFTTQLTDTLSNIPINNAKVFISSNAGDTIYYKYSNDGWYNSKTFAAETGKLYTLNVAIDTVVYKATGSIIPMEGIDTLYSRLIQNSGKDSSYYVYFNVGQADKVNPKYYQTNFYKNDSLVTKGRTMAFFSDKYLISYADLNIPFSYAANDTIKLELLSISKEMYLYYNSLFYNLLRDNISSIGYQTNPPNMFNKPALGYFQVSAKDEKTIVIKRQ